MGQLIGDLSTALNTILTLTIQNKIQLRALLHVQKKQLAKLYNQDEIEIEKEMEEFMARLQVNAEKEVQNIFESFL